MVVPIPLPGANTVGVQFGFLSVSFDSVNVPRSFFEVLLLFVAPSLIFFSVIYRGCWTYLTSQYRARSLGVMTQLTNDFRVRNFETAIPSSEV